MVSKNWMSWVDGVDLIAMTAPGLAMPNIIVHVARMVHTPVGSAPSGMLFWQPDPNALPLAFGFVSSHPDVAAYFGKSIFAGTPFEHAPILVGSIDIDIQAEHATARVEIPGYVFKTHLSGFAATEIVNRAPGPMAPFQQQGLESPAGAATLYVNDHPVTLVIPPVGITGGPCAVYAPCGIYSR